jgi:hypothetical protein
MSGAANRRPTTSVVDMSDFPSPADRARREGNFVPAAGFALIPPGPEDGFRSRLWIPFTLLVAAGAGAYHLLRGEKTSPPPK